MPSSLLEQTTFKRMLIRAVVIPGCALFLLAVVLAWQISHLLIALQREEHTDAVITQAQHVLNLLVDMEAGQRGYLVAGQSVFLDPYHSAETSLPAEFAKLDRLVSGDSQQTRRLDDIRVLYGQWAGNARREIMLRERGRNYRAAFASAKGKRLMDRLRAQFSAFDDRENQLRQAYGQRTDQAQRWVFIGLMWLTLIIGAMMTWTSIRHLLALSRTYQHSLEVTGRQANQLQQQADALRKSEAQFRLLFADNPLPMWAYDLETLAFLEVNEAAITQYGYSHDEFLNLRLTDIRPVEERERLLEELGRERTGLQRSGAWLHQRRNGEVFDVEIISHSLAFAGREAVLVVAQDVTERKQLERELQTRMTELQTLMDVLPAIVWIADDPECRRITGNRAAYELMHAPPDTNISKSAPASELSIAYKVFQDGREVEMEALPMQVAARTGMPVREVEQELLLEDGTRRSIYGSAAPLFDAEGRVRGSVATFVDITERNRHEREIERLNVQLRRAMTETHHRVKNNLQVISALMEMQELDSGQMVPVQQLRRINQHIRSLAVLHELLTQEAKHKGDVNRLASRSVLGKLIPMLQEMIGSLPLRANVQDIALSPKQATALAILVNELVNNAAKYGGGYVQVTLTKQEGQAQLTVCDGGPGFPLDFDPKRASNTGLELIASVGNLDLQGVIRYENQPQGGACVRVLFPLAEFNDDNPLSF